MRKICKKSLFVLALISSIFFSSCNNNLSKDSNPSLDEQITFYSSYSFASGDIPSPITIGRMYDSYKNKDDIYNQLKNSSKLDLIGEDEYICYYVKKDIYNEIKSTPLVPISGSIISYSGIFQFIDCYRLQIQDDDFLKQSVMIKNIKINIDTIIREEKGYCLIDIAMFYKERELSNKLFVNFVSFKEDEKYAYPNFDTKNKNMYYWFLGNQNTDENTKTIKMSCIGYLNYYALRIEFENDTAVLKTQFDYNLILLENNPNYYDDLNACIVDRTLIRIDKYFEKYDITFDFYKIKRLFEEEETKNENNV